MSPFPFPAARLDALGTSSAALDQLLVRDLLSARGGGLVPKSPTIASAALRGRGARWRRERHRDLAAAWRQLANAAAEGHHLLGAGQPSAALTALRAAPEVRVEDLLALLNGALDPAALSELIERVAPLLRARGELERALALADRLALIDRPSSILLRAELLCDAGEARRAAASVDGLAPSNPRAALVAARASLLCGARGEAERIARLGLPHASAGQGQPQQRAALLNVLGLCELYRGAEACIATLNEAARIAATLPGRQILARVHNSLGMAHQRRGERVPPGPLTSNAGPSSSSSVNMGTPLLRRSTSVLWLRSRVCMQRPSLIIARRSAWPAAPRRGRPERAQPRMRPICCSPWAPLTWPKRSSNSP